MKNLIIGAGCIPPFLDEPVSVTDFTQQGNPIYAYHLDLNHSVRYLTDSTPVTKNSYDYPGTNDRGVVKWTDSYSEIWYCRSRAPAQDYLLAKRKIEGGDIIKETSFWRQGIKGLLA